MRYLKPMVAAGLALTMLAGVVLVGADEGEGPTQAAATVVEPRTSASSEGAPGGSAPQSRPIEQETVPDERHGDYVVFEPVTEVIPGHVEVEPGVTPSDPIGGLDLSGRVPEGLGLAAFPGAAAVEPSVTPGIGGPQVLTAGPGCHNQCITSGTAYPRGFGAEVVVDTNVPAEIFVSVIADTNGDGDYEFTDFTISPGMVTDFRWALDDLDPGQLHHVMAAATDEHDNTSYVWGEFTTLSERSMQVALGDVTISGGPDNISDTHLSLRVDGGEFVNATPGEADASVFDDLGSAVDLHLLMRRSWNGSICEAWGYNEDFPQGHDGSACEAWNSAFLDDVDLDVPPAGQSRWTSTTVQTTLQTPTGAGGALPAGYGDPYRFSFTAPVSVFVTYS